GSTIPIIVCWHRDPRGPAPADTRSASVRGSNDRPCPVAINRDIALTIAIVIFGNGNICRASAQTKYGIAAIGRADDRPNTNRIIDRDVSSLIAVKITRYRRP